MGIDDTLIGRVYFTASLLAGRALRSARYSTVEIGDDVVRKRRSFLAPLLVALGIPLVKLLDTGVRVVSQKEWEQREAILYDRLYSTTVRLDGEAVVLPKLRGRTLASLLEDTTVSRSSRDLAIQLSAKALADLHRMHLSHGDAMAENAMIDLDARAARWFDFETVHEADRPMEWRRADDLRALVSTALLRTTVDQYAASLRVLLDGYGDEAITREVAAMFTSVLQRPLSFHLGQAPLSYRSYRAIGELLKLSAR